MALDNFDDIDNDGSVIATIASVFSCNKSPKLRRIMHSFSLFSAIFSGP